MTPVTYLGRAIHLTSKIKINSVNFLPRRGLKSKVNIKWTRPDRKSFHDPCNTGDLAPMPSISKDTLKLEFQNLKEIQSASDEIKKIFSLEYQFGKAFLQIYEKELVDRVRRHAFDDSSKEVKIAKLTARIRFYQPMLDLKPKKSKLIVMVKEMIDARMKNLRQLRQMDYKKFEWLLDKLDLEYKPTIVGCRSFTRKTSLVLLAKLQVERDKEAKLAEMKKSFDEQKVPFLEKKLEKLKWIKEMEGKHNIDSSVTDEDIKECIQQIEKTKIEVSERMKRGYVRKIHPYFLEPYDECLILEKEKMQKPLYYEEFLNEKQEKSS